MSVSQYRLLLKAIFPMKTTTLSLIAPALLSAAAVLAVSGGLNAQDAAPAVSTDALKSVSTPDVKPAAAAPPSGTASAGGAEVIEFPGRTDLDEPGNKDSRLLVPADAEGKTTVARLSKIDLDADLDYDGTFDNTSTSEQVQHEFVPPGLELGKGEVSRLLIRFKTYEVAFGGKLVVSLELASVNRETPTGLFEGGATEATGQVRVWRDQTRKELLLDSADASKKRIEWTFDPEKLSGGIPRTVYIEGVKVAPKSEGDLRLLVMAAHVAEGSNAETPSSLFQTAFDHLLVTVRDQPVEKEFINNNVEGVWSNVGDAAPAANAGQAVEGEEGATAAR